jgi:hypothetical protein
VIEGSRVTEARIEPPEPPAPIDPPRPPVAPRAPKPLRPAIAPKPPKPSRPPIAPTPLKAERSETLTVTGRLSATETRARNDARARFEEILAERLEPEVPRSWTVPDKTVDRLINEVSVTPRQRDYGTVYEATLKAYFSERARAGIVGAYHRELVQKRLVLLGGLLAFVLVCLGALSGYIRADEATKGYYTTRLRLAAAAGVGAAGVLIYQMMT